MLYVSGVVFAVLIVIGQSLYKVAVEKSNFALSTEFLFSKNIVSLLFSPYLITGFAFFLAATAINFWMFTKWDFSPIQAATVPVVLAASILIGWKFFGDQVSLINLLGIGIMIIGVMLSTIR